MRKILYTAILLTTAASLLPASLFGQLSQSGKWNETAITNNQTIDLTGDVTINGTITIGNANGKKVSLTINNSTDSVVTIKRTKDIRMFRVLYGATLTINGNDGAEIVIHGGADLEWDDSQWEAQKKKNWTDCKYTASEYKYKPLRPSSNQNPNRFVSTTAMIRTNGNLELNHVRIEQFNAGNNNAHAIHIEDGSDGTGQCGFTKLTNCKIRWCRAQIGSAIYVGYQDQYKNNDNEKCAVTLENVYITECMVNPENGSDEPWGGVIRTRGRSVSNLNMINCTMTKNYSTGIGSCVLWNAGGIDNKILPKMTFINCRFTDNRADQDGGAVRLESSFDFEGEPTIFEGNSCGQYGGAIVVVDYEASGDLVDARSFDYNLNENLEIKGNYAGQGGGGIAFVFSKNELKNGFTFNINLNGPTITENEAGERGGGILFANTRKGQGLKTYYFNVYLNSGTISKNTAVRAGGGIFAKGMDIKTNTIGEKVTISANTVTAAEGVAGEVGAKGGGGGINLYDGTMHLNTCEITGNTVIGANGKTDLTNGYGGGILINRGTFTLDGNDNKISNNKANVGGGIAVLNATDKPIEVGLLMGNITANTAHIAGGGVAVVGNIKATINGVNITNENKASNGGGLYLHGREDAQGNPIDGGTAIVTYEGGQISGNKAVSKQELTNTTARNKNVEEVSGMGGGIFVHRNSTLELLIERQTELGIQKNTADNGADDVFCNGTQNTLIVLPGVASMTVEDGDKLFWVEDYITNDKDYKQGTNVNKSWNSDNIRYRYAVENNQMNNVFRLSQNPDYTFSYPYQSSDAIYQEFRGTYMCLTLGSVFTNIILEKKGMAERDNAIFKIYRWELGSEKPANLKTDPKYLYMTMILTDRDKAGDDLRRKRIQADYGYYYYVEETPWSWAYTSDPKDGLVKKVDKEVAANEEARTFTFTNAPKDDTPGHAESVKVNEMPGK